MTVEHVNDSAMMDIARRWAAEMNIPLARLVGSNSPELTAGEVLEASKLERMPLLEGEALRLGEPQASEVPAEQKAGTES